MNDDTWAPTIIIVLLLLIAGKLHAFDVFFSPNVVFAFSIFLAAILLYGVAVLLANPL